MTEPNEQAVDPGPARKRIAFDTDDVIPNAVKLRALKTGRKMSEAINDILREALASEIEEVTGFPKRQRQRGSRGRKS